MGRNLTVSIAKGIGIILMVLGHADVPYIWNFIYMFHMPLFFVLSGYCFKEKYLNDFKTFGIRKITGLYFPFLKWGIFFLLFHNIFFHLNIYNGEYGYRGSVSHLYSIPEILRRAFIGCGLFLYPEQLLGGYWFLVQLFWASIIGFVAIKFVKSPALGAFLLLLVSFCLKFFLNITIPYTGIGSITFLSASFFVFGYALKNYNIGTDIVLLADFFTLVMIGSIFWNTTMQDYSYKNLIPFALTGIIGSMMVLGISSIIYEKNISNNKIARWVINLLVLAGDCSLVILTWHFISFKVVTMIIIAIEGYPKEMLAMFPVIENDNFLYTILYVIAGIGIPLFGLKFIKKLKSCRPFKKINIQKR